MSAVSYQVVKRNPFTVKYTNADGKAVNVEYDEQLLPQEIESEMPFILFDDVRINPSHFHMEDDCDCHDILFI